MVYSTDGSRHQCMDGWWDGLVDGWLVELVGLVDGWMDGRTDGLMDR